MMETTIETEAEARRAGKRRSYRSDAAPNPFAKLAHAEHDVLDRGEYLARSDG